MTLSQVLTQLGVMIDTIKGSGVFSSHERIQKLQNMTDQVLAPDSLGLMTLMKLSGIIAFCQIFS